MAMKNFTTGEVLSESDLDIYCVNTIFARKTASESVTSSTTLQNDDNLVLALAASSVYEVSGVIIYDGSSAGDFKCDFTGPSGASIFMYMNGITSLGSSGSDNTVHLVEAFSTSSTFGCTGAADHRPLALQGLVEISSTAGSLQFRWAQDASNATATRTLAGSWLCARRVD